MLFQSFCGLREMYLCVVYDKHASHLESADVFWGDTARASVWSSSAESVDQEVWKPGGEVQEEGTDTLTLNTDLTWKSDGTLFLHNF